MSSSGTQKTPEGTSEGDEGKKKVEVPVGPTFDLGEKALARMLNETTWEKIHQFIGFLEVVTIDQIEATKYGIFEFVGFDPYMIARKFLTVNNYYREIKGMENETLELLRDDIMFCIAACIYMGNLQKKSLQRRTPEGRMKIQYLVQKYNIKIGSTSTGQPSDMITFPRCVNSFPVLSCRMASVLPSKNFEGKPFLSVSVPKPMRLSAFGSFCGSGLAERTKVFLLQVVSCYTCDQTITVSNGEEKKQGKKPSDYTMTALTAHAAQWDYVLVSSTSKVPRESMKKALLTELKVVDGYEGFLKLVRNYRTLTGDETTILTGVEFKQDILDYVSSADPENELPVD